MPNIFGRLDLGKTAEGENPNGFVAQNANGTFVNNQAPQIDDYVFGRSASGSRWNKTEPDGVGKMEERGVPRPISVTVSRRK